MEEYELEVIDVVETTHKNVEKGRSWRIVSINPADGQKVSHKVESEPKVQIGWVAKISYSSDQTSVK